MNARILSTISEAAALVGLILVWVAGYAITNPLPAAHHMERRL